MTILHIEENWEDIITYDAHGPDKCSEHLGCAGRVSVVVPEAVAEVIKAVLDAHDHVQGLLADLYDANTPPPQARRAT